MASESDTSDGVRRDHPSLAPASASAQGKSRVAAPVEPGVTLGGSAELGLQDTLIGMGAEPVAARLDTRTAHLTTAEANAPARDPLEPGMVFGQYELIRELGRGGMGAVYLARDTRLGRLVAIKFLTRRKAEESDRFLAEARATARCRHENIVVIHDVDEADDCPFMVLEYLEGITLRAWLSERWSGERTRATEDVHATVSDEPDASGTPVSPTLAVELVVPVARALQHAHGLGLVHRDLKPENVMLTDNGTVKVLDFGIAKVLDLGLSSMLEHSLLDTQPQPESDALRHESQTLAGVLVGTLPYMAPEQWANQDVDGRTDIWAVGIMLWELCTGRHPLAPLSRKRLLTISDLDVPMPSLVRLRPDLRAIAEIVDACLKKPMHERLPSATRLLEALEPLLPRRMALYHATADEPADPYAGLAAFQKSDAMRFFGRERDISSLTTQIRNHRMITVAGATGAGKSSLIRAGVIPALERSGQSWRSFIIRPGRYPLANLTRVLTQIEPDEGRAGTGDAGPQTDLHQQLETLRAEPGYLGSALRWYAQREHTRVLLFVDQFEELYTLGADRDTREVFVRCLEAVADDASSPLRVVFSLRSDFLDRVAEDREFTSALTRTLVLLPSMGRDGLRHALERPLEPTGYAFESAELVEEMLDALMGTRSPLPLLQFTAARLWQARDRERRLLTLASYRELGGIAGALAVHADAVLASLSTPEQRLARTIFTSLVSEERTRAIVSLDEMRALAPHGESIERVVRALADARLILVETGGEDGSMVELAHESLIERWPKLGQWLDEDQEEGKFRTALRGAAREWHNQGRSEDLLWRGQAADEARRWLARVRERAAERTAGDDSHDRTAEAMELGPRDRDFLEAVVDLATRARRRRRNLAIAAFSFVSGIALVVSVLAVYASREATRAEHLAAKAERQAQEIAEHATRARSESLQARNASRMASAREYQSDPTLTLALLRELEPASALPKRWDELARWAVYQGVSESVQPFPDAVSDAHFSPDGTRIVAASFDGQVRVWRADGQGEPVVLGGHDDFVYSAAFSPDGTRVVSAGADHTVRVWPADGRGREQILRGHTDVVYAVVFSPDGSRIASASRDATARIWRIDGATEPTADPTADPTVLAGHDDWVYNVVFDHRGARIATASWDGTARIWRADGAGQPTVLRGHTDRVYAVAFSPDGTRLVTGSRDQTARVWRIPTRPAPGPVTDDSVQAMAVLEGHRDIVYSAAFSPDGERIVTASKDRTARLWNADGTGQPLVFKGHRERVYSADFSPDGTRLATASADKTLRVWRADGGDRPVVLRGHDDVLYSALFSPDGTRVATASWDRTARIWDAGGAGHPTVLAGHDDVVYSADFSPDGTRCVTASRDTTVRVWALEPEARLETVLRGHGDRVYSAGFSPDGTRIVSASKDHTARVWNADGTGQPIALVGHDDFVYSAGFSPDGKRVVTASWDGTARVWNADGSGQPIVLEGHEDRVFAAAFSPDGTRIVTASRDKTARLWKADGSGEVRLLEGHEAALGAGWKGGHGAFTRDGTRVVTASLDNTIRVWRIDHGTGAIIPSLTLHAPDIQGPTAAFSPDGTRIVSASHGDRMTPTGEVEHTARIWPYMAPFSGPDDPALWRATSFCPSVELRVELLGVPEYVARANLDRCRERVAAASR